MKKDIKNLFQITEAAQACGLSRSTLMRMEEKGLLTPAYISPTSGRRYYDNHNVARVLQIEKLKAMGLGTEEIAGYFASGGEVTELLSMLERRLDNVVFRLGFANTRREARQLVNHGHFTVNGKRVDIPSYLVKPGEVIAVCEKSRSTNRFKMLNEGSAVHSTPKWIEKAGTFEGKIIAKPVRDDIDFDVAEHLIVELYSK